MIFCWILLMYYISHNFCFIALRELPKVHQISFLLFRELPKVQQIFFSWFRVRPKGHQISFLLFRVRPKVQKNISSILYCVFICRNSEGCDLIFNCFLGTWSISIIVTLVNCFWVWYTWSSKVNNYSPAKICRDIAY